MKNQTRREIVDVATNGLSERGASEIDPFTFLQSEGYLMQGCFKVSLSTIRAGENAVPGPLFAAFFNYTIGLERLLKLVLVLESWHRDRKFPSNDQLRAKGHKLAALYSDVQRCFEDYGLSSESLKEIDPLNKDLLNFLSEFANGSRYYNLDGLATGSAEVERNPVYRWQEIFYRAYAHDHPGAETVSSTPDMSEGEMSPTQQIEHHVVMGAARRYICWRLVQLILPHADLLRVICDRIHEDDMNKPQIHNGASVPYMEEFLDFVSADRSELEQEGWPFLD